MTAKTAKNKAIFFCKTGKKMGKMGKNWQKKRGKNGQKWAKK